jgi:hypothetical protein
MGVLQSSYQPFLATFIQNILKMLVGIAQPVWVMVQGFKNQYINIRRVKGTRHDISPHNNNRTTRLFMLD